jgi:hypothetical protein
MKCAQMYLRPCVIAGSSSRAPHDPGISVYRLLTGLALEILVVH